MFRLFKKADTFSKAEIAKSVSGFERLLSLDLDAIWALERSDDFLPAIYGWLCRKCDFGKSLASLSAAERTVYIVRVLEDEVLNGGFSQYLCNSSGQQANETLAALTDIGAERTAAIYQRVLAAVGTPVPQDEGARLEMITDEAGKLLNECDAAFSAEADNLQALCKQYILAHRAQFS